MTEWITELIYDLGYTGLAILTFIENIFPPIPSEIIMPLGGFLVAEDQLRFPGVVLAGTIGSVAGGLVLYYVGRLFNQEQLEGWVERHGRWLLLKTEDIEKAFDWFDRHGYKAIFLARLIPGVRSLISVPAGADRMALAPFILYTSLGTALWSGLLAYGGMVLGENYEQLGEIVGSLTYVVLGVIGLAALIWLGNRFLQQRGEAS